MQNSFYIICCAGDGRECCHIYVTRLLFCLECDYRFRSIRQWLLRLLSFHLIMQSGAHTNWNDVMTQTYELAEECLKTNYYGAKGMIEALIPLLQLSDRARIVNVSSFLGKLKVKKSYPSSQINCEIHLLWKGCDLIQRCAKFKMNASKND